MSDSGQGAVHRQGRARAEQHETEESMFGLVIAIVAGATAAQLGGRVRDGPECAMNEGTDAGNCKSTKCTVVIGQSKYCSECVPDPNASTENGKQYAPVDGKCVDVKTDATGMAICTVRDTTKGVCSACKGNSFMYQNGCYKVAESASGPGAQLCAASTGSGVCETATAGFFVPPGANAMNQSVIACNDTTGVSIGNQDSAKTYKGVADCAECSNSTLTADTSGTAKCTKCGNGKYLKVDGSGCVEKSGCTGTVFPKEDADSGNKCLPCSDATNGVKDCAECTPPADKAAGKKPTCTKCSAGKYLKITEEGTMCVEKNACKTDHFPKDADSGNECVKCSNSAKGGIENCDSCAPIAPASRADTILVTCSVCTGATNKKVRPDKKGCIDTCPDNSTDKSGICECNEGFKPSGDGMACEKGEPVPSPPACPLPGCKTCSSDKKTCTQCKTDKYMTPSKLCVSDCNELPGYYNATAAEPKTCKKCTVANCKTCKDGGKCQTCEDGFFGEDCKACDSSCKTCSGVGANNCTSCPATRVLVYGSDSTEGTCGPECTTGTGSGGCKACGLSIGGSKYCSECSEATTEYPQDGVCGKNTRRAAMCKDASKIKDGKCTECANDYFLMNGGCYKADRLPGKAVCTAVDTAGGTCKKEAPGYKLEASGTLVTCSAGCSVCTSDTVCTKCLTGYYKNGNACMACPAGCSTCANENTCSTCMAGYYLTDSSCTTCPAGCAACIKSGSDVMCLLSDGSVNRSGLSTGAIAGISVAAVLVVGGLVGFLCWWFACRSKA